MHYIFVFVLLSGVQFLLSASYPTVLCYTWFFLFYFGDLLFCVYAVKCCWMVWPSYLSPFLISAWLLSQSNRYSVEKRGLNFCSYLFIGGLFNAPSVTVKPLPGINDCSYWQSSFKVLFLDFQPAELQLRFIAAFIRYLINFLTHSKVQKHTT